MHAKSKVALEYECIDNLPLNAIAVLLDFAMNYGHEHQDSTQQEWWSAHQTTLLPVVVYYRTADGTLVCARSHVYMSADLSHSHAFVQHVMDGLISDYAKEFQSSGRELEHVVIWSDGCASQFKNKKQVRC